MTTIKWRVYEAPEGGGQAFCGEFDTVTAARAHAETEPDGLWDYQWATARAAGSCDGLQAPPEDGIEDDEAESWHGQTGRFCVVRTVYPAIEAPSVDMVSGTVGGWEPMGGTWRINGRGERDLAVVLSAISSRLAELGVDYGVDVTLYHADGRSITDDLPSDGRWLALRL